MNEKRKILEKLFAKQRFGIKPGLDRTLKLAEYFSNPHKKYNTIHVAGTNGKGSVASYLASIFTEAGYKTGLYTSPHLVDFNERIRINGTMITDEEMTSIANDVMPVADETGSTFFEITTVMAFEYFARTDVEIAIIEAGMGGRYDSTNIIDPELAIITSVDLDHQVYLGGSVEEIAYEKAGIIKNGIPVVISEFRKNIKEIFINVATEKDADIYFVDSIYQNELKINDQLQMKTGLITNNFDYSIETPLPGVHQVDNLKIIVQVFELLKTKFNLNLNNLYDGINKVKYNSGIKFRTEIANEKPLLIADAAHNPAALKKLGETINLWKPGEKFKVIFGAMKDKDIPAMLNELMGFTDVLILTQAQIERTATISELFELATKAGFPKIIKFDNVKAAINYFLNQDSKGIITGSFYITGEALEILG